MLAIAVPADLSQLLVNAGGPLHKKMAPEFRGHGSSILPRQFGRRITAKREKTAF
jgi:hypothetical protein